MRGLQIDRNHKRLGRLDALFRSASCSGSTFTYYNSENNDEDDKDNHKAAEHEASTHLVDV
jgi:hypothetical protein